MPAFTIGAVQNPTFTIGEAARRAGVSPDTVRYYERRGVVPAPPRTNAGYRRYVEASVQRILFVRNALRVGFTLKEVAAFLRARDEGQPPCRDVRAAAGRLIDDMDRQIAEMVSARAAIVGVLGQWDKQLAATPAGTAARLLETELPRGATRRLQRASASRRSAAPPSRPVRRR